jgi:hypothetical protein
MGGTIETEGRKCLLDAIKPVGIQTTEAYCNCYLTDVKYEEYEGGSVNRSQMEVKQL